MRWVRNASLKFSSLLFQRVYCGRKNFHKILHAFYGLPFPLSSISLPLTSDCICPSGGLPWLLTWVRVRFGGNNGKIQNDSSLMRDKFVYLFSHRRTLKAEDRSPARQKPCEHQEPKTHLSFCFHHVSVWLPLSRSKSKMAVGAPAIMAVKEEESQS